MAKKSSKKAKTVKPTKVKGKTSGRGFKIEQALIDNFVSMQRVLTNLTVKFDSLADQISKLLQLFEISAKSFVEKQKGAGSLEDREFAKRLNVLLEQNKTIARGLTLLEQKMREKYSSGGISGTGGYSSTSQNLETTPTRFSAPEKPKPSYPPSYPTYNPTEENEENRGKIKPKPLPRI